MLLAAGVGLAAGEVPSVNVVGYGKVTIPPTNLVLVATTFETFGDSTLDDLVGDQLPAGSTAYIWDRVGKTYIPASVNRFGAWSTNTPILRGDAFWLRNSSSVEAVEVSLRGEVPYDYNNAATTTVSSITNVDAVAYAYPADVLWTNTALSQALAAGDTIYIWDGGWTPYSKSRLGSWGGGDTLTISAGRAFFVESANLVDWTEVAPYDLD
jgi:hypothetical protein